MRGLKIGFLVIGVGLLGLIVWETDVAELGGLVGQVGWGILLLLLLYFVAFLIDTITWHLTLPSLPGRAVWLYRLFLARLAGEAFNATTPVGGMGGEPVKAVLLKKCYGVDYREGIASLILAKTINVMALVLFLAVGFILVLDSAALPDSYKIAAGMGLGAFGLGVFLFFAIQRFRIVSWTGALLTRGGFLKGIARVMDQIREMDERLVTFYTAHGKLFAAALGLAWLNWVIGVVEIYFTMIFLGHPISLGDAWILEAAAQLVRAGSFFIPASIGVQEGTFLLIGAAITGSPTLGLAAGIVRRVREILWIVWGFAVFWFLKPRPEAPEAGRAGQRPSRRAPERRP